MKNEVRLNLDELRAVRREIAALKNARVRVGIMGDKVQRPVAASATQAAADAQITNVEIGLIHEFGSKAGVVHVPSGETGPGASKSVDVQTSHAVPARSFLRMPLLLKLPEKIDDIGRATWRALIAKKGLIVALKSLGQLAENVVQRAFATGGFGQWAPLSRYTIRKKGSSAILIDKAYLRKSITSAVVVGKASA